MLRKIFSLAISFVIVASFGFGILFANVPAAAAQGVPPNPGLPVGCDGINAWAASNVPGSGSPTFWFWGEDPGAVITVEGTNVQLIALPWPTYVPPLLIGPTSSIRYITSGSIILIGIAGSPITELSCEYPVGESLGETYLFRDGRLNGITPNAPVVFWPTEAGIVVYGNEGGLILDVTADLLALEGEPHGTGNVLVWQSEDGLLQAWQHPDGSVELITADPTKPIDPFGMNYKLWESADGMMSFWRLSTGEYQFMYGPDGDGDVYVNVFDAMPPSHESVNLSYNVNGGNPKW